MCLMGTLKYTILTLGWRVENSWGWMCGVFRVICVVEIGVALVCSVGVVVLVGWCVVNGFEAGPKAACVKGDCLHGCSLWCLR